MKTVARAAVVVAIVALAGVAFVGVTRALAAPPPPRVTVDAPATWIPAPGPPAPVPLPPAGSFAVDALANGSVAHLASLDAGAVRPIASVAKTMTALVVLETHPLAPGAAGPTITITATDVDDYVRIANQDGSVVPVQVGERFSERDLLLGLMLPSANNLALTAARWVDGSVASFVTRLNARAAALGMARTHFADPDGLDSATTSTASDLVMLGEAAVANDQLVSLVSTTTATMPDGTVVHNLDQLLLGTQVGWIGIKTGWTPQAGGCLLFASRRPEPAGAPALTVVGAALGQPVDSRLETAHPELSGAFVAARAAVDAAFAGYTAVAVGPGSVPASGAVSTRWGEAARLVVRGPTVDVLLRDGDALTVAVTGAPVSAGAGAGARAGTVTVSRDGSPLATWGLVTDRALSGPSLWWRLTHG